MSAAYEALRPRLAGDLGQLVAAAPRGADGAGALR